MDETDLLPRGLRRATADETEAYFRGEFPVELAEQCYETQEGLLVPDSGSCACGEYIDYSTDPRRHRRCHLIP